MKNSEFIPENYEKVEVKWNMGFLKMNLSAIMVFIIAGIMFGIPFFLINTEITQGFRYDFASALRNNFTMPLHISALIFIALIIVHEFLHAFFYSIYCKNGFKSIKIGVEIKSGVVYAACKEIIPTNKFIIGLIMPGIITGVMPVMVSIFIGSGGLFLFGLMLTSMSIGAMYILSQVYEDSKNTWFHNTVWLEANAEYEMCLYQPK